MKKLTITRKNNSTLSKRKSKRNKQNINNIKRKLRTQHGGASSSKSILLPKNNNNMKAVLDTEVIPDAPTNKKSFTLMTFNVFTSFCKEKTAYDYIKDSNIDIICIQEYNRKKKIIENYVNLCPLDSDTCGTKNESVNCFYKKIIELSNPKPEKKTCIVTQPIKPIKPIESINSKKDDVFRASIIFTYNDITIANLHLAGGRYDDQMLAREYEKILKYKLQLLILVIDEQPDIICGDFNSVYSSNIVTQQKYLDSQYEYFEQHCGYTNKENIKKWNEAPFELLLERGYKYSKPDNEDECITNGRGNSIVDAIWFKDGKIKLTNTTIQAIMVNPEPEKYNFKTGDTCTYSDHNPIITTVTYK